MSADEDYQLRYRCYSAAHNKTPDEIKKASRGSAINYIVWVQNKWQVWAKQNGRSRPYTDDDHKEFDQWLNQQYKAAL